MENHLPPHEEGFLTSCISIHCKCKKHHSSHCDILAEDSLDGPCWDIIKYMAETSSHDPLQSNAPKVRYHLWNKGFFGKRCFCLRHESPQVSPTRQMMEQEAHNPLSLPWCEHQRGQGCWILLWKAKERPPISDTNLSQAENKYIIYHFYTLLAEAAQGAVTGTCLYPKCSSTFPWC